MEKVNMDRNLVLDAARVSEAGALASARWRGQGQKDAADQSAVDAMRTALNRLEIRGQVVIGEGERDEAPMLYIGEKVGIGTGPEVDIALDPLEGTDLTAQNRPNALAVIAFAEKGKLLHAPDVYMDKIAVGGGLPPNIVDLDDTVDGNLRRLADAKRCDVKNLMVCILDRERHDDKIAAVRAAGAGVTLIQDGDVYGVMATSQARSGIDMYIGAGGAPEGVLACAALRCIGGQFQGRLLFRNEDEKDRARRAGITDFDRKYDMMELAAGDVIFAATGVTDGNLLRGVEITEGGARTESLVMRSSTGTVRRISTVHDFSRKDWIKI